ncbi:MAG: short-chain fatty acid transporter [Phycisphaerales bacterium]
MIAKLGQGLSRVFAKTAPDPFVLAVLLTVVTGVLAWWLGFGNLPEGISRVSAVIDSWRDPNTGMWRFLGFGMQMCLILVTGHALAESKPVAAIIRGLTAIPKTPAAAAALIAVVAMLFGLINWGLGLIVGALLARDVARALDARGVSTHAPVLAAAGYAGMLVWHGGLSGTAPIKMTSVAEASSVLPPETIAILGDSPAMSLGATVFSPMNLFVTGGLLLIVPAVLVMLTPKDGDNMSMPAEEDLFEEPTRAIRTLPDLLERTPMVPWTLAALLIWAMLRFGTDGSESFGSRMLSVGPNEINMTMLALGLIAHGSIRSYIASAERGAKGCAGVILQFPLYAGIMGMLATSGLIGTFSDWMASNATQDTLPIFTFVSAGIVNLFVPSGGGQWAIQGPIALQAGQSLDVAPQKMIMAVAYGDQLTNMLQPFWALPLLAITGVRARDIVGYTAIMMLAAGAWMALGLLVF